MWLTRFAITRPVITMMVFAALAIFGIISYFQLGRSANPPGTTFPIVIVAASYPGASPQDMEKLVIKPIEDQLDGIDHLDQVSATAQEGSAVLVVQFKLGTDLDLADVDVQRRVDTARVYMPSDLNPPDVYKNGSTEPLLDIAVSSPTLSQPQIADLVNNQVKPLVSQIPNVASVDVYGTADREFHVMPDPAALVGTGATLEDIFNAVAANNNNVPGGIMTQPTREATVAIHAYIDHASDIAAIPLSPVSVLQYPVKSLKIGDVARVEDGHVEMRSISHYNGLPRVYLSIGRDINSDELKSTDIARERMKSIEAQFPQLTFTEIDAPADYTKESLVGVGQSLIEGIFLTAIVMLLFLHAWRNAVVVMISIPASILATFIVMHALDFRIDTMSMMGLSLIIGILVDDSIVVLENITRHRDLGEDPQSAAINGRSEIGGAAIAITMVDVVVFLPVAFLPGIVGAYLKEFGAVVVISTLFSLFVSFTLTPLLAAKWSVRKRSEAMPGWLRALDSLTVNAMLARRGDCKLFPWRGLADHSLQGDRRAHRRRPRAQSLRASLRRDSPALSYEMASVRTRTRRIRGLFLHALALQCDQPCDGRRKRYAHDRRRIPCRRTSRPCDRLCHAQEIRTTPRHRTDRDERRPYRALIRASGTRRRCDVRAGSGRVRLRSG